ncbi:MAG: hypothetical protein VB127_06075 [Sphaerochaeta sp.]|nr:hypothetical protein [Sphaerochaeta sp.]
MKQANQSFPKPQYSPVMRALVRMIGPWYLHLGEGIKHVDIHRKRILDHELQAFIQGKQRLIIAFRHTAKEDAPVILVGVKASHLRFLYGRDVLNWAGKVTRFLFPRLGFVAVQNRYSNREGIELLKSELKEGRFPLCLAPEGQVTYHMFHCAKLQAGLASFALWAMESSQEVTILPIATGYEYPPHLEQLFSLWEQKSSYTLKSSEAEVALDEAFDYTLSMVADAFGLEDKKEASFGERRDGLCAQLLKKGEQLAGLEHEGLTATLDRLFALRYAGQDILFGPQLAEQKRREEAQTFLKYSQVVDILEYLDREYGDGEAKKIRHKELMLNLLDVLNRVEGGSINTRYTPKGKRAHLLVGDPIRVNELIEKLESRKQRLSSIDRATYEVLEKTSKELETIMFPLSE